MYRPAGGHSNTNQAVSEASDVKTTIGPLLQARRFSLAIFYSRRARLPIRLMLGLYVKPMEWGRPSVDTSAPGLDKAQSIIDRWKPFNYRDSFAAQIRELYPNIL